MWKKFDAAYGHIKYRTKKQTSSRLISYSALQKVYLLRKNWRTVHLPARRPPIVTLHYGLSVTVHMLPCELSTTVQQQQHRV